MFLRTSSGKFKSLELADIAISETAVKWDDLPVGSSYYKVDDIRKEVASHEFVFGGRGNLICKEKKLDKNIFAFGSMSLPIVAPIQREALCYQAKDRAPTVVALKIEEKA